MTSAWSFYLMGWDVKRRKLLTFEKVFEIENVDNIHIKHKDSLTVTWYHDDINEWTLTMEHFLFAFFLKYLLNWLNSQPQFWVRCSIYKSVCKSFLSLQGDTKSVSFVSSINAVDTFAKSTPIDFSTRLSFVTIEAYRFSELRLRLNLLKRLLSVWSLKLMSLLAVHVHAFIKLFLKLSERKAYNRGLMEEFEYARHPTSTNTTISNFVLQCSAGVLMRKICMIQ